MWNVFKIFKTILIHYSDTDSKSHLKGRKKLTTFVAEKCTSDTLTSFLLKGAGPRVTDTQGLQITGSRWTALINLTAAAYAGTFYFSNHIYYLRDVYKPLVRKTEQVLLHFACEKTRIQRVR